MCGSEAIGIIGESTLACLAAKHECGSGPGCLGCNVAGMEEHTAHGVGFAVRAIRNCPADFDKTDEIGNPLESLRGQSGEVHVCLGSGGVSEICGDQKLACGASRRYPCGEIDCAAEIIAFTIEDRAAVRTDVQRRELWLGVDEAVYRQAERDGVWGLGEHQHERITDLFEDPASVSRCAAATVPLNLRKTSAAA